MIHSVLHVRREGDLYMADWGEGPRRCAVGRGGIGRKQAEGDGITPGGTWPLRRILYRADRIALPDCALPAVQIAANDGWCDAPYDFHYNCAVKLPYQASAEKLWRDDELYDIVVVMGYNDSPAVPGRGSALFVHIARPDYAPTEGCVALSRADLLQALSCLSALAVIDIHP